MFSHFERMDAALEPEARFSKSFDDKDDKRQDRQE
jgi:hypothetical protein